MEAKKAPKERELARRRKALASVSEIRDDATMERIIPTIIHQRLPEGFGLLGSLRKRRCRSCKASDRPKVRLPLLLPLLKPGIRKLEKEKADSKAKEKERAKVKAKEKVKEKEKEKVRVSTEKEALRSLPRSRSFAGTSSRAIPALTEETNALGCTTKRSSTKTETT